MRSYGSCFSYSTSDRQRDGVTGPIFKLRLLVLREELDGESLNADPTPPHYR